MINSLPDEQYIFKKAPWLSWKEVLYGLDHGYIDEPGVSKYACESLNKASPSDVYDLASLEYGSYSKTRDILEKLIRDESNSVRPSEAWAFIILSWIFDNKENYHDPFEQVDSVYAELDYPEELSSFVRYMPLQDGVEGSDKHLLKNWANYLYSYNLKRKTKEG